MESLPHDGPWHGEEYPRAKLTTEEQALIDKVIYDMKHPSKERTEEFLKKWHEAFLRFEEREALPPEEREAAYRKLVEENPIYYSPPYPPIDPLYHQVWSAILSLGILDVQIVKQDGQIGVIFHRDQTITLEKGKFYPIVPNGGEEQQKAFGKS